MAGPNKTPQGNHEASSEKLEGLSRIEQFFKQRVGLKFNPDDARYGAKLFDECKHFHIEAKSTLGSATVDFFHTYRDLPEGKAKKAFLAEYNKYMKIDAVKKFVYKAAKDIFHKNGLRIAMYTISHILIPGTPISLEVKKYLEELEVTEESKKKRKKVKPKTRK